MATQVWHRVQVENASDICEMLNDASTCWRCEEERENGGRPMCKSPWHFGVNDDATDAPVWGDDPRDGKIYGAKIPTVWSWDENGVVVGGDGTFDEYPFQYWTYTKILDEMAPEVP